MNHSLLDRGFKQGMSEYCDVEYASVVGKRGDSLNLELCDDKFHLEMKKRHRDGLLSFCQPESARSFGASGKVYNGICPTSSEPGFLREYRAGRRAYLQLIVTQKERSIRESDRELDDMDHELERRRVELLEAKRRENSQSELERIQSNIEGIEDSRLRIRKGQEALRIQIQDLEKEILQLDSSAVLVTRVNEDLRLLSGLWHVRSALRGGIPFHQADSILRVEGSIMEERIGAQVFHREFSLDPTQTPKQIDLIFNETNQEQKKYLGIYEIQGKELRLCYAPLGAPRPREFSSTPENQNILSFSKR